MKMKMTQDGLDKIIDRHKLWLDGNKEGERAILKDKVLAKANLEDADLDYADLEGANLIGANLNCTNLRGASLRGADLRGANLRGANLEGAILDYANLKGVKGIMTFQYNRHLLVQYLNRIAIGCKDHTIGYWLENFEEIGEESGYSEEEIEMYGNVIKMIGGVK